MKVKVTRKIEINGKIEEKSAEVEIVPNFQQYESMSEECKTINLANSLFQSLGYPTLQFPPEPVTTEQQ